jgi:hypothetical protein
LFKALSYKPEGRGFDYDENIRVYIYLIIQDALRP